MVAGPFGTLLGNLNQMGFFQFLFPFLLVLAIVYGVLKYTVGGAGDKSKAILPASAISLISIVAAFFAINYSGGVGVSIAGFFSSLFGGGAIVATAILLVLILLGLFGIKATDLKDKSQHNVAFVGIVGVIALIVFSIVVWSGNAIPGISSLRLDSNAWTAIAFVVILLLVMWFLGKEKEEKSK